MPQSTNELITLSIAIYGAVLATLGFILSVILAIHEIAKQRPKIKVIARNARINYDNGKSSELLISIEAVNTGSGSLVLTGVGWVLKDKSKLQILKPYLLELPIKLDERRKCCAYVPCREGFRELKNNKEIIGVFYQDETGQQWNSKISRKQKNLWMEPTNDGLKIIWNPDSMSYSVVDE